MFVCSWGRCDERTREQREREKELERQLGKAKAKAANDSQSAPGLDFRRDAMVAIQDRADLCMKRRLPCFCARSYRRRTLISPSLPSEMRLCTPYSRVGTAVAKRPEGRFFLILPQRNEQPTMALLINNGNFNGIEAKFAKVLRILV